MGRMAACVKEEEDVVFFTEDFRVDLDLEPEIKNEI